MQTLLTNLQSPDVHRNIKPQASGGGGGTGGQVGRRVLQVGVQLGAGWSWEACCAGRSHALPGMLSVPHRSCPRLVTSRLPSATGLRWVVWRLSLQGFWCCSNTASTLRCTAAPLVQACNPTPASCRPHPLSAEVPAARGQHAAERDAAERAAAAGSGRRLGGLQQPAAAWCAALRPAVQSVVLRCVTRAVARFGGAGASLCCSRWCSTVRCTDLLSQHCVPTPTP